MSIGLKRHEAEAIAKPRAERNRLVLTGPSSLFNGVHAAVSLCAADPANACHISAMANVGRCTMPRHASAKEGGRASLRAVKERSKVQHADAATCNNYVEPMNQPAETPFIDMDRRRQVQRLVALCAHKIRGRLGRSVARSRPVMAPAWAHLYDMTSSRHVVTLNSMLAHLVTNATAWQADRLLARVWGDNAFNVAPRYGAGFASWSLLPGVVMALGKRRDVPRVGMKQPELAT